MGYAQSKLCNECHTWKWEDKYYTTSKGGLDSYCKECRNRIRSEERIKRRLKALQMYGNKCACCGESDLRFLSLDHINNDGHMEGKSSDRSNRLVSKLSVANTPREDIQVLCYNCNMGKHINKGICPHVELQ